MRTGLEAMRLGSIIYFLPFFFVLNPALVLNGPIDEIITEIGTAILGIGLIAAGLQGHLVLMGSMNNDPLSLVARFMLIASGLLLAFPEMMSNLVGLGLMLPAAALARKASKRNSKPALSTDASG
jgi:TRAP-type uncharacterized transport system fused permease subunit